jgi:hypothetical protein
LLGDSIPWVSGGNSIKKEKKRRRIRRKMQLKEGRKEEKYSGGIFCFLKF